MIRGVRYSDKCTASNIKDKACEDFIAMAGSESEWSGDMFCALILVHAKIGLAKQRALHDWRTIYNCMLIRRAALGVIVAAG